MIWPFPEKSLQIFDLEKEIIVMQCSTIFVKFFGMEKEIFGVNHRRNGGFMFVLTGGVA